MEVKNKISTPSEMTVPADFELSPSDNKAKKENHWFEQSNRLDNDNKKQDMDLRKLYARYAFILVCVWIIAVLSIIVLDGFNMSHFALSDKVLITLLTTTSANIFGFLFVVFNYFFKNKS
jgi:hypothetical protein